ncbi:glycosyltransferase family 4 protein [Acetobacter indonesiensis]|uniref:Glycosyl transferase n=1 Tax=Acetobacter indonesiensis TaxID=104101 RepID=A0A6N3T4Y0_9PROT|nr:glycosyltransferase family 4 protein [Acetobacter indonesiensis]GAN63367.1 mannosy/glycosyl ltransferase [Acetobacter indonesiensis]GEN03485.1 glycosyl transferase [Acetobacter indonesiensis]
MTSTLHPLHRLWRLLPVERRRRALAHVTSVLAPKASWPAPACDGRVVVAGELSRQSGLGEGARLLLRGLQTHGISAEGVEAGLLASRPSGQEAAFLADRQAALLLHVNSPQVPAALLRLGRPAVKGRRIVGYWVWELPKLPPEWQAGVAGVHEIWTPSHFSARALDGLKPGCVRVVPYPLADAQPQPSALTRASFGWPDDAVVVLTSFSLASSFARKNPLAAIAAFRQAFGDRPDRILVMKVSSAQHYEEDLRRLQAAAGGAANIRFETRNFPMADVHAMTRNADIVLSLHRSEGLGLVPAEAMLLERPVIATDWSATAEFLTEACGVPVPYTLVPATDDRGVYQVAGAMWADADVSFAAQALRKLADDSALRAALGQKARQAALRAFSPQPLLDAVAALTSAPAGGR